MKAETTIAICAALIAVLSLVVSFEQARSTRNHNRKSLRPILEFTFRRERYGRTGVQLSNHGVGPALIVSSEFFLDGQPAGSWDETDVNRLRDGLPARPRARTYRTGAVIPAGRTEFILFLDSYDPDQDIWLWDLVRERLRITIEYESLYGGEGYRVTANVPRERTATLPEVQTTSPPNEDDPPPGTTQNAP